MMDETKFAGYKDTLVHAAKQMAEEYSDAMTYASMAMDYKTVCPYASSEWYKLSGEEMEHADANRRIAQKILSGVDGEDSAAGVELHHMWSMAEDLVSGLCEAATKERAAYMR